MNISDSNNTNTLNIMFIGYSGSGKTLLQGSCNKLGFDVSSKGISLQALNFIEKNHLQKVSHVITNNQGEIGTTIKLINSEMVLKKGLNNLLPIKITDVEGQALEADRSLEVAERILKVIVNYHALILVIEYPTSEVELQKAKQELAQLLNFASYALEKNPHIALTLLINKIDRVPEGQMIKEKSDKAIASLKEELKHKYRGNQRKFRYELKQQQGFLLNKFVKPLAENEILWDLCEQFFILLGNSSHSIPAKVFLTSAIGFGHKNADSFNQYVESDVYKPYGSVAAFLWTVYACLEMQSNMGKKSQWDLEIPINQVIEDIRCDLQEWHKAGDSYFDPDENSSENLWALRNCTALRAGIDDAFYL